jgi:hypothetical protein
MLFVPSRVASACGGADGPVAATVAERVGTDDGCALVLDFSGDVDGSLENCGCHYHPMGGHVWRTGYVNAFAKAMSGNVPLVQVDAGHSLSSGPGAAGLTDEARVRDDYLLRGFESLHVTAANVSHRDLPYLAERMRASDYERNVKQFPALESYVSANVTPIDASYRAFRPYVIREVRGARIGDKPVRVGFLGLTELAPGGATATIAGAYRIGDPVAAAKRYVPELRKKCDLVVVLAYVDRDMAKRIGMETSGIDLILAAHQFPLFNAVDEASDAVVAYVASQTKWLGEFRLFKSTDPKGPAISNYVHRDVPLDNAFPDDPAAVKLVDESRAAIAKFAPQSSPQASPK